MSALTPIPGGAGLLTVPAVGDVEPLAAAWLLGYPAERTRRAYGRDLAGWLAFCNAYEIEALVAERVHIDAYGRNLAERRDASPATVAQHLSALSSFYGYLVAEGVIERSPVAHVRRPKVASESPSTGFAGDELRALLAVAEARAGGGKRQAGRNAALVTTLAYTGLRIGELLAADVEDLDWERGHRVLRITRKGGARARVALAPAAAHGLETYVSDRQDGPLFVTASGQRLDEPAAWRVVRSLAKAAGLAIAGRVNPHSFRHAFVTLSRDAGVALEDVQDAVGHADPRTTRRYDRARHNLDCHPGYTLATYLARSPAEE